MNSDNKVVSLLGSFLKSIIGKDNDIAAHPNPFRGLNPGTFADATQPEIDLVDGGEDGQNVPLWPLVHPERQVDVILSLDASADTPFSWPNGRSVLNPGRTAVPLKRLCSSLVQTRSRVMEPGFAQLARYPNVPADTNTFVNRGLNA